jgi:hypothetical protein
MASTIAPVLPLPDLAALADLLRLAVPALEAYAQRELAVTEIYNAGREDERALLTAAP